MAVKVDQKENVAKAKSKAAKEDYEANPNVAAKKGDILELAEAVEDLVARVAKLESK